MITEVDHEAAFQMLTQCAEGTTTLDTATLLQSTLLTVSIDFTNRWILESYATLTPHPSLRKVAERFYW